MMARTASAALQDRLLSMVSAYGDRVVTLVTIVLRDARDGRHRHDEPSSIDGPHASLSVSITHRLAHRHVGFQLSQFVRGEFQLHSGRILFEIAHPLGSG